MTNSGQFFLQKQGMNSWFRLKQDTAILETGNYRLLLRLPAVKTRVELKVSYDSVDTELNYQQSHCCYSNEEGLVSLLPFTDLAPGRWEFSCDSNSDVLEDSEPNVLQLQMLPNLETEPEHLVEQSVREIEDYLQADVDALLDAFSEDEEDELEQDELATDAFSAIAEREVETTPIELPWQIILERDSLVWNQAESLVIAGRIQPIENNGSSNQEEEENNLKGILLYRLKHPQNQAILWQSEQEFSAVLPFNFNSCLQISPEWQTNLILGEIILKIQRTESDDLQSLSAIASQPFTITADTEHLLVSTSNQEEEISEISPLEEELATDAELKPENIDSPVELDIESEVKSYEPPKNSKFANLHLYAIERSSDSLKEEFKVSPGQILPPKLGEFNKLPLKEKSPQLPEFCRSSSIAFTLYPEPERPSQSSLNTTVEADLTAAGNTELTDKNQPDTPLDRDFAALQLEERFLARLNALTDSQAEITSEDESNVATETEMNSAMEEEVTLTKAEVTSTTEEVKTSAEEVIPSSVTELEDES